VEVVVGDPTKRTSKELGTEPNTERRKTDSVRLGTKSGSLTTTHTDEDGRTGSETAHPRGDDRRLEDGRRREDAHGDAPPRMVAGTLANRAARSDRRRAPSARSLIEGNAGIRTRSRPRTRARAATAIAEEDAVAASRGTKPLRSRL
jgi:hypothetical protein